MGWLTSIFGAVFSALGWLVLAIAVAVAVALSIFKALIPAWVGPLVIVLLGCAFVGSNLAHKSEIAQLKAELVTTRAEHATVLAEIATKTARTAAAFRTAEIAAATAIEKVATDGQSKTDRARADAASARAASDRLRQQLANYRGAVRSAAAGASPAAASAPAETALDLLSDLLARSEDRAGEIAEFADLAHAAGSTCERAYDAARAKLGQAQLPNWSAP